MVFETICINAQARLVQDNTRAVIRRTPAPDAHQELFTANQAAANVCDHPTQPLNSHLQCVARSMVNIKRSLALLGAGVLIGWGTSSWVRWARQQLLIWLWPLGKDSSKQQHGKDAMPLVVGDKDTWIPHRVCLADKLAVWQVHV